MAIATLVFFSFSWVLGPNHQQVNNGPKKTQPHKKVKKHLVLMFLSAVKYSVCCCLLVNGQYQSDLLTMAHCRWENKPSHLLQEQKLVEKKFGDITDMEIQ